MGLEVYLRDSARRCRQLLVVVSQWWSAEPEISQCLAEELPPYSWAITVI